MVQDGFIKLDRKMLNWEWYTDANTARLFIHCLFKANWKDGRFQGVDVPRGSFVTSIPSLAKELKLSSQSVRTALSHLKSTGELTDKSYSKYRIITVKNYDEYQTANRQTNSQLTGNQQATNSNRRIERKKEEKEERVYEPSAQPPAPNRAPKREKVTLETLEEALAATDYSDRLKKTVSTWLKYREEIKKPFKSAIGFTKLLIQIGVAVDEFGETKVIDLINEGIGQGWQGIVFDRLKEQKQAESMPRWRSKSKKDEINDFMHSDDSEQIAKLEKLFLAQTGKDTRKEQERREIKD